MTEAGGKGTSENRESNRRQQKKKKKINEKISSV